MATGGFFAAQTVMRLMHTPADALPFAIAYLRIIFLGIPFLYLYSFLMMSLRGAGDSRTPFLFLLVSVGLDVCLNPVFIFGLGPIPAMGIAGSATATLIAQVVSLFGLLIHVYRTKHFLRIQRSELGYLRIDPVILRALVAKGVPMGLQMIVISLGMIVMIRLVNRFGSETTAAYGAAIQLWNYIQMPAFAVGQAVSAMAAQNVGARKWDRVDRVAIVGIGFNTVLTGTLVAVVVGFGTHALALFLPDAHLIAIAQHINVIITWSFILFGVNFVLGGVMRATGGGHSTAAHSVLLSVDRAHTVRALFPRPHRGRRDLAELPSRLCHLADLVGVVLSLRQRWKSARMLVPVAPPRWRKHHHSVGTRPESAMLPSLVISVSR